MATKIRLRRMGARNNPFYRLVVADSRFATTGRYLEVLGWYDPKKAEKNFSVKVDRVDYWLGVGAQMSATAKSLIKKARAGEGVAPGAALSQKTVDPEEVQVEVAEDVEAPIVEEVPAEEKALVLEEVSVVEATALIVEEEAPAPVEEAVEEVVEVTEEAPEKQEA